MYRRALFRKYDIRECAVQLERMSESQLSKLAPKKKLSLLSKVGSPRWNISWMPNKSATRKNSSEALSALDKYRLGNGVVSRTDGRNVIRQRAKSLFVDNVRPTDSAKNITMDDFHVEFNDRYNKPNRGLKTLDERHVPEHQPRPLSEFEKIRNELKAKLEAKKAAANAPAPPPLPVHDASKLSWDQLKSLEVNKYPVVQCVVKEKLPSVSHGFSLAYNKVVQTMIDSFKYVLLDVCLITCKFFNFNNMFF